MSDIERDVLRQLRENQEACIAALERNDAAGDAAYRALTEQEARLMDTLRAIWVKQP